MFLVGLVCFVIGIVVDRKNKISNGEAGQLWKDGRLVKVGSLGSLLKNTGGLLCALAVMLFLSRWAQASAAVDVYKCTNAAGKVEFQDRPCDTKAKGERLNVQPNSAGNMSLEEVRAKAAALKSKQQARQDAEDRAAAADYAARQQAWQQDRAHQDAIDMQQTVRASGASAGQVQYNNGFYARQAAAAKDESRDRSSTATNGPAGRTREAAGQVRGLASPTLSARTARRRRTMGQWTPSCAPSRQR